MRTDFSARPARIACAALVVLAAAGCAPDLDRPQDQDVVRIPGGAFIMGTPVSAIPGLKAQYDVDFPGVFENETPAHEVTVGSFHLDRHEVTKSQFAAFLYARPEWGPGQLDDDGHNGKYLDDWFDGHYPENEADLPMVHITWAAAQAYCRWAGGRLPTEAEWEYAARASEAREFPWGDEPPSPDRVNYYATGVGGPTKTCSFPQTGAGLCDLAGNVWEFLYDAWEDAYPRTAQTDPVAGGWLDVEAEDAVRGRRSVRGASYGGSEVNLRTRWRDSHVATNAIAYVGFRCAYPDPRVE